MKSLLDSFSYAAGLNIAGSMKEQGITTLNNALLIKGIEDVLKNNTPLLTQDQANLTLQKQLQQLSQKGAATFTKEKCRRNSQRESIHG
jgi:FKBP-type peptidyl-prolyl cis-trans isomerase FklB